MKVKGEHHVPGGSMAARRGLRTTDYYGAQYGLPLFLLHITSAVSISEMT